MLKPADDYTGRYAQPFGKSVNVITAFGSLLNEIMIVLRRNQHIRSEFVSLRFLLLSSTHKVLLGFIGTHRQVLYEYGSLSVQQYVTGFVKECEPQMIVGLVPKTQLNE